MYRPTGIKSDIYYVPAVCKNYPRYQLVSNQLYASDRAF